MMFRKAFAALLCAALATTGCASAAGPRVSAAPQAPVVDRSVLADYVVRIPAGSKVRVERAGGQSLRGTLMKATPDAIVVQKNTRVPEPAVDIPLSDISRVTLDTASSSLGKHIAIGVAAGVGATFGVLLVLAALISD
jgi:hypothetical protein